jgi:hypothetical protein
MHSQYLVPSLECTSLQTNLLVVLTEEPCIIPGVYRLTAVNGDHDIPTGFYKDDYL